MPIANRRSAPKAFGVHRLQICATLLSAIISLLALPCLAQTGTQHEYELKAGVLYHLIEYVEWPDSNKTGDIQVGLVGQIPYAAALQVLNGKTIQGRKIIVKQLSTTDEIAQCKVLYIATSERPRLADVLSQVKGRPILTVGELEGFAQQGGIVNLVAGPNRIILEINRSAATEARLGLSSQLLKLAKIVSR